MTDKPISNQALMTPHTLGEKLAVMQHQIIKLEEWPPRVEAAEKQIELIRADQHALREAVDATRQEAHQTNNVVVELRDLVMKLFWTGAGVFLACSSIWAIGITVWKFVGRQPL